MITRKWFARSLLILITAGWPAYSAFAQAPALKPNASAEKPGSAEEKPAGQAPAAAAEGSGQGIDANIEAIEELMNMRVVTATKREQLKRKTPSTVMVITARQIRQRGYQTLEDVLGSLPGIQFRNLQGFNTYTFMRGLTSQNNKILILVDGIRINELNSGGFYGGSHFNLANVKRIEVLYGPASSLYGTNAISGVVNIITRNPEEMHLEEDRHVAVSGGNFNSLNGDFSYALYSKETGLGISTAGMYRQTDRVDLSGQNNDGLYSSRSDASEQNMAFDSKITWRDLTAGFLFQDKSSTLTTAEAPPEVREYGTDWHIRYVNPWVRYSAGTKKLSNTTTLHYLNTTVLKDTLYIYPSQNQQARYYRPNELVGLENQTNYSPAKELMLTLGLVYEYENLSDGFVVETSNSADVLPPEPGEPENRFKNHLFSTYLQMQYLLIRHAWFKTGDLDLVAGGRFDHSSYFDNVFTPRAGLVHNLGNYTGKVSYAEAYRAPRPWDFSGPAGGRANPGLKPEKFNSFEGSMEYVFWRILIPRLTVYKNTMEELIILENDRNINRGQVDSSGIEAGLTLRFRMIEVETNYSYTDSTDENGDPVPEIATHGVNTSLLFHLSSHLKWNIDAHYLDERQAENRIAATDSFFVDPYLVVDTTLSMMNYNGITVQLMVKNLFDSEYYHPTNRTVARIRQSQRTITGRLMYSF